MEDIIKLIINYSINISIISTVLSFSFIRSYLLNNKLIEKRIAYLNLYNFLNLYYIDTKYKFGKVGLWFYIFIISFIFLLFFSLCEFLIQILFYRA